MKLKKILTITIALMALAGCGGGGSSEQYSAGSSNIPAKEKTQKATLLDSKVIHAKYNDSCGHSGYTDNNGIFEYKEGCKVSFWADSVFLGRAEPIDAPENLHLKSNR